MPLEKFSCPDILRYMQICIAPQNNGSIWKWHERIQQNSLLLHMSTGNTCSLCPAMCFYLAHVPIFICIGACVDTISHRFHEVHVWYLMVHAGSLRSLQVEKVSWVYVSHLDQWCPSACQWQLEGQFYLPVIFFACPINFKPWNGSNTGAAYLLNRGGSTANNCITALGHIQKQQLQWGL